MEQASNQTPVHGVQLQPQLSTHSDPEMQRDQTELSSEVPNYFIVLNTDDVLHREDSSTIILETNATIPTPWMHSRPSLSFLSSSDSPPDCLHQSVSISQ